MYTLYWERQSGAIAPQVMLEEMGIEYDRIHVDMAAGEHRTAGYLALNPTGQVPALRLPEGNVIGESAAIVLFLGERHPNSGLVPRAGEPDRGTFLYWLLYLAATGYMTFSRYAHPERHTVEGSAIEGVRLAAEKQLERFFDVVEQAVGGRPWFLERGFCALDIYLAMLTTWHADREAVFGEYPGVASICDAVGKRPTYRQVMQDNGN